MILMTMKWKYQNNDYYIKKTHVLEVKMPIYEFACKKCDAEYDELCSYDKSGKYSKVKCPECGSKKKEKLMTSRFTSSCGGKPKGTSKEDSFSYMAGHNMEGAKGLRRHAEENSHMGLAGQANFYDKSHETDVTSGKYEGEVK